MKTCSKCRKEKSLDKFGANQLGKFGRHSQCLSCHAALSKKRYYDNHEASLIKSREGYAANSEYHIQYRAKNSIRINKRVKAWREANPTKVRYNSRVGAAKRRALKAECRSEKISASWISILLAAGCEYCTAPAEHLEHMVPLSRGGSHTYRNLTGSCAQCNLTKATKIYPDEWPPPFNQSPCYD